MAFHSGVDFLWAPHSRRSGERPTAAAERFLKLIDSTTGRNFELSPGITLVGRADDGTIQIRNPSVSSRHCEITVDGQHVVIKDLGSTNGTFVNGEPVTEAVCGPGSVIRVGEVDLHLREAEHFETERPVAPVIRQSLRRQEEEGARSDRSSLRAKPSSRAGIDIRRELEQSARSDRQRMIGFWILAICGVIVVLWYWKVPATHEGSGRGSGGRLLLPPLLGAVYGLFQLVTGIHIFELGERLHEMSVINAIVVVLVFLVCAAIVVIAFISLAVAAP